MTLLEILVKELPGKGGWPVGPYRAIQTEDSYIRFPDIGSHYDFHPEITATDKKTAVITREQYEAALAGIKKEAWGGEGLPPVGCQCEIKRVDDWMPVTIKFISSHHTVFTTFGGTEVCYQTHSLQFRPIRSEKERKQDDLTQSILNVLRDYDFEMLHILSDQKSVAVDIAERIVAGDIPHVKIL